MTDRAFDIEQHIEDRARENVRQIASRLRRVADDLDRAAEHEKVETLPETVAHTASWGVANLAQPAMSVRELHLHRQQRSTEAGA